jgi:hypothetical protein
VLGPATGSGRRRHPPLSGARSDALGLGRECEEGVAPRAGPESGGSPLLGGGVERSVGMGEGIGEGGLAGRDEWTTKTSRDRGGTGASAGSGSKPMTRFIDPRGITGVPLRTKDRSGRHGHAGGPRDHGPQPPPASLGLPVQQFF